MQPQATPSNPWGLMSPKIMRCIKQGAQIDPNLASFPSFRLLLASVMSFVVVDALGIVVFRLNIIAVVKVVVKVFFYFFESFQSRFEKGEKKSEEKAKKKYLTMNSVLDVRFRSNKMVVKQQNGCEATEWL